MLMPILLQTNRDKQFLFLQSMAFWHLMASEFAFEGANLRMLLTIGLAVKVHEDCKHMLLGGNVDLRTVWMATVNCGYGLEYRRCNQYSR
jgi:hypothetical protein